MESRNWTLKISAPDGSAETAQFSIEARNWVAALRRARGELGEQGGVPHGSTVVMSADGEIVVQDARGNRLYKICPVPTDQGQPPFAQQSGSIPPANGATPPPQDLTPESSGLVEPPGSADSNTPEGTSPDGPSPLTASPEVQLDRRPPGSETLPPDVANPTIHPPQPTEQTPQDDSKGNQERSDPEVDVEIDVPAEDSRTDTQDLVSAPASPSTKAPPESTPPSATTPEPADPEPPAASADGGEGAKLGTSSSDTEESDTEESDTEESDTEEPEEHENAQTGSPVQEAIQTRPTPGTKETQAEAPGAQEHHCKVLASRDEAPSDDLPLSYCERSYFVTPSPQQEEAESMLRARLEELQSKLEGRPRGQFINLALFDHEWSGRPDSPPIATLQWKDWRGAPIVSFPMNRNSMMPPATDPRERASWPVPGSDSAEDLDAQQEQVALSSAALITHSPTPPGGLAAADSMHGQGDSRTESSERSTTAPPNHAETNTNAGVPGPGTPPQPKVDSKATEATPAAAPDSPVEPEQRLALAFEAMQDLYFIETPAEGLDFGVELLQKLIPSEAVSAGLYDINTDEIRLVSLTGPGGQDRKAEAVPCSAGLYGVAISSGREVLLVDDVHHNPNFEFRIDGRPGLNPSNMLYMVLQKDGALLGAVQLINRTGRHAFDAEDASIATYVSQQLAKFLQEHRVGQARS